jgi:hypothetical protein
MNTIYGYDEHDEDNYELLPEKFNSSVLEMMDRSAYKNNAIMIIATKLESLRYDNNKLMEYINSVLEIKVEWDDYCPISKVYSPFKCTFGEYYHYYCDWN